MKTLPANLIIRHEDESIAEPSACGQRYRLLSEGDKDVAAWAHAVDIDGAKLHCHKICTELYYVLNGEGKVVLDGQEVAVRPGSMIHIPPSSPSSGPIGPFRTSMTCTRTGRTTTSSS